MDNFTQSLQLQTIDNPGLKQHSIPVIKRPIITNNCIKNPIKSINQAIISAESEEEEQIFINQQEEIQVKQEEPEDNKKDDDEFNLLNAIRKTANELNNRAYILKYGDKNMAKLIVKGIYSNLEASANSLAANFIMTSALKEAGLDKENLMEPLDFSKPEPPHQVNQTRRSAAQLRPRF